jgi:hypothetical protein
MRENAKALQTQTGIGKAKKEIKLQKNYNTLGFPRAHAP